MSDANIADLFQIQHRFLRSTHLERDFGDASSLQGYVLTSHNRSTVERMVQGLAPHSSQRAWRITGDYGTGKSSFGLFLARLLSGAAADLPAQLQKTVDFETAGVPYPRLLPILVTGSREPLSVALLRAVRNALQPTAVRGRTPAILHTIQDYLEGLANRPISDDIVLDLLGEANTHIRESNKGTGILIILDELGKFLEYAALHPERQDVYFLQRLAEVAARSTRAPLFVVGLLHQGFSAYADQLSQTAQKEWDKIASRYEEVLFNQPLDETAALLANALNVCVERLPDDVITQARVFMQATLALGWFGPGASRTVLINDAPRLYPLHPSVLPILVRLFNRFGQNERSLFSFLFSNEPFGLRAFAEQPVGPDHFYRLHNLYDYARAAFGHQLGLQSYRSHWNYIDSIIESFPASDPLSLQVLKTVGILNLLDTQNFVASPEVIRLATSRNDGSDEQNLQNAIIDLQKGKHVLYFRGVAGGYCLWPHTSVNLDRAYRDALQALEASPKVAELIKHDLQARPVVARRHYIETGNLRHFEVRYSSVASLSGNTAIEIEAADGLVVIPLCETEEERQKALQFAASPSLVQRPEILVAVPHPLNNLAPMVHELRRWEWVERNTPELNHDPYAAEEVSRQVTASRRTLEQRLQNFLGIQQGTGRTELQWFHQGQHLALESGPELLSYLSKVCNDVYPVAPKITNELINRRSLSSAAAAARMRLIEQVLSSPFESLLGMDERKRPPEMAMYLSVLKKGRLHRQINGTHTFAEPDIDDDPCRLRPTLHHIREILQAQPDERVPVVHMFAELRRPPFGLRDGVIPLLLAVFVIIYEHNIALYENGSFLPEITAFDFLRLTKAPETFEIQFYQTTGVRVDVFESLLATLHLQASMPGTLNVLDIVRPLAIFAAKLPLYTQKTKHLSDMARAVRTLLMATREPATLLFRDLPEACGCQPFGTAAQGTTESLGHFVERLQSAIDELQSAYPALRERIKTELTQAFEFADVQRDVRIVLSTRAGQLLPAIHEPRLRGFCLRLSDTNLSEDQWLEALGSYVCSKPPAKWSDLDIERFSHEVMELCAHFKRTEAISFSGIHDTKYSSAYRIAITRSDGAEVDQVLFLTPDEELQISDVEERLVELLRGSKRLGLAAASRVLLKIVDEDVENSRE